MSASAAATRAAGAVIYRHVSWLRPEQEGERLKIAGEVLDQAHAVRLGVDRSVTLRQAIALLRLSGMEDAAKTLEDELGGHARPKVMLPEGEGFAQRVRSARGQRQWSQEYLALRAGLHPTMVSRLERNEREPSLRVALKISAALDVSLDVLTAGEAVEER